MQALKTFTEQHKPLANGKLVPVRLACFPPKDNSLSAASQLEETTLDKEYSLKGTPKTSQVMTTIDIWNEAE